MAEIAAASSVGGLLSLTIQVIQISQRYVSGVRNASKTIKGYFRELEVMRLVLNDLEAATKDQIHALQLDPSVMTACSEELETLRSKLCKRSNSKTNHLNRLTWPFAEDDTRRWTEVLHRYQSSLHALLSTQNYRLSAATLSAIQTVSARQEQDVRDRLVQRLSIADPLANHTAARDKYEPATGEWFLRSKVFATWIDDPSNDIWIRSFPGAGKTILCSTIIDHLLRNQSADDFILFYYFDFRDDRKQTLGSLLRSLIAQICVRLDCVPDIVSSALDAGAFLDIRSLASLFHDLATSCGHVKVVIDALDESHEREHLLDFLRTTTQTLCGTVQWMVTSRHEKDIETALAECSPLTVSLDKDVVNADIKLHIDSCLVRDRTLSSRPAWIKQLIRETLLEKANGMFQYVQCQLGVLRDCPTGPATENALRSLPIGIDETYERMLLNIRVDNWRYVHTALMLLALSARPMRLEEVAEAAVVSGRSKPFDPRDRLFDCKDIVILAAGLIVSDDSSETVVLSHYSVQEYLFSSRIQNSSASFFALKEEDSHCSTAEICMSYMLSVADLTVGYHGIGEDYPLLEYASQHWLQHAQPSLRNSNSAIFQLVLHLVDGRKSAHRFWLTFHDVERRNKTALESLWSVLSPDQILTVLRSPGFVDLPNALLVSELCGLFIVTARKYRLILDLDRNFEVLSEVLKIIRAHFSHSSRQDARTLLFANLCIMESEGRSVDWAPLNRAITLVLFGRSGRREALRSLTTFPRNSGTINTTTSPVQETPINASQSIHLEGSSDTCAGFATVLEEVRRRLKEERPRVSPGEECERCFESADLDMGFVELEPELTKLVTGCAKQALSDTPPHRIKSKVRM